MGGDGPTTFDRVLEYCDGWLPISGRAAEGPSLPEKIQALKRRAEDVGRDPDTISISVFGARPDPENVAGMEDAGVDRVIFSLPSEEADTITPLLDEYARLIS
jgi:alkanesulfonate monooxygenase SsuD/methylene tetrahydromethanopterin reductase-like flavin-dependent oxidoreductase (luciferase family)